MLNRRARGAVRWNHPEQRKRVRPTRDVVRRHDGREVRGDAGRTQRSSKNNRLPCMAAPSRTVSSGAFGCAGSVTSCSGRERPPLQLRGGRHSCRRLAALLVLSLISTDSFPGNPHQKPSNPLRGAPTPAAAAPPPPPLSDPSRRAPSMVEPTSSDRAHQKNLTPPSAVMGEHPSHKKRGGGFPFFAAAQLPHGVIPPLFSNSNGTTDANAGSDGNAPPSAPPSEHSAPPTAAGGVPPRATAASTGAGKPPHHHVRNLISALSFDSVFRRSPSSGSRAANGGVDDDATSSSAAEALPAGTARGPSAPSDPATPSSSSSTRPSRRNKHLPRHLRDSLHVQAHNVLHGTLDPDGGVEVVFYDCLEYGDDGPNSDAFQRVDFRRDSVVMESISLRGGALRESIEVKRSATTGAAQDDTPPSPRDVSRIDLDTSSRGLPALPPQSPRGCGSYPPAPPPPDELPLRFLRAGKGDVQEGLRRYRATLDWRARERMDTILREPNWHYPLIKRHYPHFFAGQGRLGEPCFYEQPPKTNLKALKDGGVTLESLLRHYAMVTEFQWQYLERDDLQRSIYIIDLDGIRLGDFVGEVVDFVKKASVLSAQHYPERAGYVFVINVPAWFKLIFSVVKPLIDESTLDKIYILRGAEEIRKALLERIPIENIPADYGGQGPPLGQSKEEAEFRALVEHNNALASGQVPATCSDGQGCRFCAWQQPRSY